MGGNSDRQPQPLDTVLFDEGLSYKGIAELCPSEARVGEQTVADIATGRARGSDRSRSRILNAINRFEGRKRTYVWDDLFDEPPKGRVGRILENLHRTDA